MTAYITEYNKDDETDYSENNMPKCPICGSKPFISRDIVDGFYFGWSVGCPRYCNDDGIHNNPEEPLTNHYLNNKDECIKWWNEMVERAKAGGKE